MESPVKPLNIRDGDSDQDISFRFNKCDLVGPVKKSASSKKVAFNQDDEVYTYNNNNNTDNDESTLENTDSLSETSEFKDPTGYSAWSSPATPPPPPTHTVSTFESILNSISMNSLTMNSLLHNEENGDEIETSVNDLNDDSKLSANALGSMDNMRNNFENSIDDDEDENGRNHLDNNTKFNSMNNPRHSISYMKSSVHHEDGDSIYDKETTLLKLKHNSFSNLSLNEKLDIFLTNNDNVNQSTMDDHLNDLNTASKSLTNTNINNLSASMSQYISNPTLTHELKRQSSGSSQSSLQSLRDDNRILKSDNTPIISTPIQFNDGIKGFPDELANEIIPSTHENITLNDMNVSDQISLTHEKWFPNQETTPSTKYVDHDDTFDKSYMSQSNSIMNLLNSASNFDLHPNTDTKIKQEPNNDYIKSEFEDDQFIKSEFSDNEIKSEFEDDKLKDSNSLDIKSEDNGNDEAQSIVDYDSDENASLHSMENAQVNSVSDIGRSSTSLKTISTGLELKGEDEVADLTKDSLRFHMDSDWKLDHSNDGDGEDNDEDDTNDVTVASRISQAKVYASRNKSIESSVNNSAVFEDASEDLIQQMTPPSSDETSNALANSSNIAPPEELTLPMLEKNRYSSLEDVTKNLNDSYEELLSAEHDEEPSRPQNFLSIWHLHERQKHHINPRAEEFFKVVDRNELLGESQSKYPIPISLKPKKFKEVNVVSRKVLKPGNEDLTISNFLPELSEDSGLEGHFSFIERNTSDESSHSIKTSNSKGVLDNLTNKNFTADRDRKYVVKSKQRVSSTEAFNSSRSLNPKFLKRNQAQAAAQLTNAVKSKFKVPSFEIKRTDSLLSPARDYYNDIFEDTIGKPTIVGHGMKTLPSMDRNDVKRIMSAKRVISQDEYSKLKLVQHKKNSVINLPELYDERRASICEASTIHLNRDCMDEELSHVATELMQKPKALVSTDQFFHDYDLFSKEDTNNSQTTARVSSIVKNNNENESSSRKSLLDLAKSPMYAQYNLVQTTSYPLDDESQQNIEKTFTKEESEDEIKTLEEIEKNNLHEQEQKAVISPVAEELSPQTLPQVITKTYSPQAAPQTPTQSKKKPIKIGSPLKIVKTGSSISMQSPKKQSTNVLFNQKLRESPKKEISEAASGIATNEATNEIATTIASTSEIVTNEIASTVSVPTLKQPDELVDRGRLFFRVVGFKNIGLREGKNMNPEFTITLDNGIHSITTPGYKMNSLNVVIGKEFELTVNESLEFIITMKMKYDKPVGTLKEVRERKVVKAKNRFSRILGQKDIVTTTKFVPIDVEDPWKGKFAEDGSFSRCYIDLDQYEDKIQGKVGTYNINCFNEWGGNKPYVIGQMEVKMLFVPRSDSFEVLPSSIASSYESIQELKIEQNIYNEGYMYQEGGDCDSWKRRFFKLNGTSLIAHSEFSHKTRAKINLSKVVDVMYVDKENKEKPKNYRDFSDVILLEHAFKIRFADGEIIDFGAPNNDEKVQWVLLIEDIVARNKFRRQPWVKLMLRQTAENKRKLF